MSEIARTTISLSDEIYTAALKQADLEKRNFSNLCEVAIEEYLNVRKPSDEAELVQVLKEAKAAGVDVIKTLTRAARRREGVAA
jgi:predicted CopG family antitoxin